MQCFESEKPVNSKAPCNVYSEAKLHFVKVTKLFQKVNKGFGMQRATKFNPTWTIMCRRFEAVAST